MSDLEVDTGQIQAQPTIEEQKTDLDKDADSERRPKKKHHQVIITNFHRPICFRLIALRMVNICKEIGLMLLIAVTYAALTNDPPKISKSPLAYPFFPKDSPVKDYYRGELVKAIELARQSDIAFIMFYAPWDAESQEVRQEFELTARYMQKLVSFNAINCWQPNGECRNHYTKVYNWPVLIAYPPHGRGIEYSGPKSALHMMRFLKSFMAPLVRVNDLDVTHLRLAHDAVIVANVDSSPGSLDYAMIYRIALRYLERDPFQEVIFAVNTDYKNNVPKLSIYTWNSTEIYVEREWKVDSLLNWIHKNIIQVTIWASPTGMKSQQLSNYIQPGPALILFTPRNPLYDSIDYYDMLREVALQYYYCKNSTRNFGAYILAISIHYNRIENYRKSKTMCTISPEDSQKTKKRDIPNTVTYLNMNKWTNNSYCVPPVNTINKKDTCLNKDINRIIQSSFGHEERLKYKRKFDEMYKNTFRGDTDRKIKEDTLVQTDYILESYKNLYKTSMWTGVNDSKSPRNLQRIQTQNKCKVKTIAEKYSPQLFTESIINPEDNIKVHITGLACQVNRSLSIIAMDSLKYHHFASSLSIDILNKRHKTALVILDEKMESHYVLDDDVTDVTIRKFIQNYSESHLKRALVTSSKRYNYTHTYTPPVLKKSLRIKELDALSFLPTVMQKNKAIIVLYHSKQCSFCNGISYIFLTTAKAFSSVVDLQFARIDGDLNTLPWEYTMDSYPTILFFPDFKKSESRIFPTNTALTVTNLLNFILSNLSPSLKLHAMWSLCNHTKVKEENEVCISKVRIETLSLIEGSLKQWRMSDLRDRAAILDKLRELKHLHLLLAHSPADRDTIQKYMRRLHWRMLNPLPTHRKKIKKLNKIL